MEKNKQKPSNTLRLNFRKLFAFFIYVIIRKLQVIFQKLYKTKCVFLNEVIWLMKVKMRLKIKNRSQRYNIDRPRPRQEHKCRKYNMCLSNDGYMNKQYLSNIWSSIHKKVEKHWGWVKKNLAYKKSMYHIKQTLMLIHLFTIPKTNVRTCAHTIYLHTPSSIRFTQCWFVHFFLSRIRLRRYISSKVKPSFVEDIKRY